MIDFLIIFWQVTLFAFIFGWLEAYIYDNGYKGGDYVLFNHISPYMLLAIALFGIAFYDHIHFLPYAAVIEDITFFIFNKTKILTHESWVNHGLSGFNLPSKKWIPKKLQEQWIPYSYIVALSMYIILEIWL